MQFRQRSTRTVLALAACQLLLACAQPAKNSFVSHFGNNGVGKEYSFSATEDDPNALSAEDLNTEPRLMLGDGSVLGQPAALPAVRGQPVKLSFEDAPLSQVVRTVLGDLLMQDYVLHPPIAGTVTLNTQKAVSADQALGLLETALQAHGMAVIRDTRGTYHVGKVEALRSLGASVRQAGAGTLAPGFGAIVVPLEYIGASEMAAILRPMVPEGAILRIDNVRNLLVLSGTRVQAEGWLDMVRTFDVNLLKGMSVGVFPLKYITIQEINAALQLMSGAAAAAAAPPGNGTPDTGASATAEGRSMFGALRILPLERLNSVLVVTPRAAYLQEAQRWIAKLDQPATGGTQARLNVYRVQNGNARHLASVLNGIFGGAGNEGGGSADSGVAPGLGSTTASSGFGSSIGGNASGGLFSGGNGGLGGQAGLQTGQMGANGQNQQPQLGVSNVTAVGNVRVMADELNNSVLIWGTPAEYERIETALKRLDTPPTQVLIEASIIEVTLNDSLKYGLQWAFGGGVGGGRSGDGTLSQNEFSASGLTNAITSGFSYTLSNSAGAIRAVLNALSSKTNLKVVASPTLMVLDNHTAAIGVGTQQPYLSAEIRSAEGGSTTTSVQYKDTGVSLKVTPSVNAGNLVTMTVDQSVTDVGDVDMTTRQRAFLQRQVSSRVAVRSGESIVMGGLIQENTSQGRSGIPVLHELPVVGNLFGATDNKTARTELIVVITPQVVRSDVDVRSVTESLRSQMSSLRGLLDMPQTHAEPAAPSLQLAPGQPALQAPEPLGASQN